MGCDNVIFRKGKKSKPGRRRAADVDPYAEPEPSQPTESRLDRPGPYDADEVDTDVGRTGRLDFGSLQVREIPGLQVSVRSEGDVVLAVVLGDQRSVLDLRVYAAPRTGGLWDELRQEMAADATKNGGMVNEHRGPYGTELEITIPVQAADGRHGTHSSRLIGVDGPRWFLRGQLAGAAVRDSDAARPLYAALADLVVVRGGAPMAPRERLPLSVPEVVGEPGQSGEQSQAPQGGAAPQGQPPQAGRPPQGQAPSRTQPMPPGQPGQPGQMGRTQ